MSKIYVLEDHMPLRRFVAANLLARGFDVVEAFSAELMLPLLQQGTPDLLVLDLSLPGMSGLQLLNQLQQEGLTTFPVMVVSAWADGQMEAIRASFPQVVEVITKPISVAELIRCIYQILPPETPRSGIAFMRTNEDEE
ncbi:MAG: response regulator [bacterium]|nr:response regulator [bacterium]